MTGRIVDLRRLGLFLCVAVSISAPLGLLAPAALGQSIKLNGPLVLDGDVDVEYQISPDGNAVLYTADQDVDGEFELFSVPIGGGTATKLNDPLVVGGDVLRFFDVSSDSSRVVYNADQDVDSWFEAYSVPIGGGTVTKLNGPLPAEDDFLSVSPHISPDSSTVVYRAPQDTLHLHELYSVPIGGGAITKLNVPISPPDTVFLEGVSPDSSTVVYGVGPSGNDDRLYSVPIAGGTSTRLNGPLAGDDLTAWITPDSSTVVYWADQDMIDNHEVYSVPIGGGTVVKLNDPTHFPNRPTISPDSSMVVYVSRGLHSVPVGGGPVTTLSPLADNRYAISPDSSTVVFVDDVFNGIGPDDIYSVPIGGGTATKIGSALTFGDILDFDISPDSQTVVYRADGLNEPAQLFSVPIGGGPMTSLDEGTSDWAISPDGARVAFTNGGDLFSIPIGGGTPGKVNGPLVSGGSVRDYLFSPDSATIVYRADQDTDGVFELFAADAAGVIPPPPPPPPPPPVQLDVTAVHLGGGLIQYTLEIVNELGGNVAAQVSAQGNINQVISAFFGDVDIQSNADIADGFDAIYQGAGGKSADSWWNDLDFGTNNPPFGGAQGGEVGSTLFQFSAGTFGSPGGRSERHALGPGCDRRSSHGGTPGRLSRGPR